MSCFKSGAGQTSEHEVIKAAMAGAGEKKIWKAFLINLDRSKDRLEVTGKRLDELGMDWQRVAGVDGQQLQLSDYVGVDRSGFLWQHGRYIEKGDIGCYLSHIKALQAFLASEAAFGLILEDDVDFPDDFLSLVDHFLAACNQWDVLKISGRHHGLPVPLARLGRDHRLVAFLTRHTGAAAYFVNRFAAQRYIERLLPMRVPYDHVFDRAWHFGFRFRGVVPLPVTAHSFGESTIKHARKLRKPWAYKLPKLAARAVNETQRGLHYLSRGLVIPRCAWPASRASKNRQEP